MTNTNPDPTDGNDEISAVDESSAIIDKINEAEESNAIVDKFINDQNPDAEQSVDIDPDEYDLDHPLARNWIARRDALKWRDNTVATYQVSVRMYLTFLDERGTDLINANYQDLIQFFRFRKAAGTAQSTATIDCSALKNLYRYIHVHEIADPVLDANYFEEINLGRIDWEGGFERTYIPRDKVKLLFDNHKYTRNRLMTYFSVGTGLRNSDVRELRMRDVDYDNLKIHVSNSKNGESYDTAMSRELASQLKRWEEIGREEYSPAQSNGYMFPSKEGGKLKRNGSFNQFVVQAAERAGLQRKLGTRMVVNSEDLRDVQEQKINAVTVHTLRHTYLTLLQEAGAPPEARRLAANHSNIEVTRNYSHGEPEWVEMVRNFCPF